MGANEIIRYYPTPYSKNVYFCRVVSSRSGCFFSKTDNNRNLLSINLIQRKF